MIARNPHVHAATRPPKTRPATTEGFLLERMRGIGAFHFLLIPGLVPDGRETFLRQRKIFLSRGDASVVTWHYESFDLELVLDGIARFVSEARAERRKPVLVGVSVGGGILLEYLRRCREAETPPPLAATILVSPLTRVDDLAAVLKRLWAPIVADTESSVRALEKGRSFFRQLASHSSKKQKGNSIWLDFFDALTPSGLEEMADKPIRKRIEKTLEKIPPEGAIERCKALRELPGIDAGERIRIGLTDAPTLILWGSKERHTLDMDGPGTGILCRPDMAERHFRSAEIQWIYTKKGESVPHASLLKHHKAYAKPLQRFLKRI